jgi:hypothetical protein
MYSRGRAYSESKRTRRRRTETDSLETERIQKEQGHTQEQDEQEQDQIVEAERLQKDQEKWSFTIYYDHCSDHVPYITTINAPFNHKCAIFILRFHFSFYIFLYITDLTTCTSYTSNDLSYTRNPSCVHCAFGHTVIPNSHFPKIEKGRTNDAFMVSYDQKHSDHII